MRNFQLTIESTDARLLGARHVSLNHYCFLKATAKKCSVERDFPLKSIQSFNTLRTCMWLECIIATLFLGLGVFYLVDRVHW